MVRKTFTLTQNQVTRLEQLAKERQLTLSDTMRRILDGELPFKVDYDKGGSQDANNDHRTKPVSIAR
jgi:hypothetical protein